MPPLLQANPFTLHKLQCKKPNNMTMTPLLSSLASTSVKASHAVAHDRNGKRLYNKALPNDDVKLRALSPNSALTADFYSSSISPPPLAHFL